MENIPTTELWEGYSKDELRELVKDFYRTNLQGKSVLNQKLAAQIA